MSLEDVTVLVAATEFTYPETYSVTGGGDCACGFNTVHYLETYSVTGGCDCACGRNRVHLS